LNPRRARRFAAEASASGRCPLRGAALCEPHILYQPDKMMKAFIAAAIAGLATAAVPGDLVTSLPGWTGGEFDPLAYSAALHWVHALPVVLLKPW
jgi:hypothetical protein